MPRTKSRTNRTETESRRTQPGRTSAARKSNRPEDIEKVRRYFEFVRAVVGGPTRNGR
jgi:hypothetical protein